MKQPLQNIQEALGKTRVFAYAAHQGQMYGDLPYSVHLDDGHKILNEFGFTEQTHSELHGAFDLHDVFEDKRATVQQAEQAGVPGHWIALALAVTDAEAPTRRERKAKTYPKLANHRRSILVKLVDRIANVRRGGKLDMYAGEQREFESKLRNPFFNPEAEPLWIELNRLLGPHLPVAPEAWPWVRMSFQLHTEMAWITKAQVLSPEEWARQHQVKLRSHQLKELQQMAAAHKA
jgi:hypothetical protein